MKRKSLLLALLLATALPVVQAQATSPSPAPSPAPSAAGPMKQLGVFALLGDSVQVASAKDVPTDSRLERTARESLDFKGIGFDNIALRAASKSLQSLRPETKLLLFRSPAPLTVDEQRAIADGAAKAELPAWLVKGINDKRLSHLLLVTRNKGTMDAKTDDGVDIGRGTVEGIGFYMDNLYTMKNSTTGAVSSGLLAPYLQIRLTLMDAQSGDVVGTYDLRDAFAFASKEVQTDVNPWVFMTGEEKVATLREMVETAVARGVEQLLLPQR